MPLSTSRFRMFAAALALGMLLPSLLAAQVPDTTVYGYTLRSAARWNPPSDTTSRLAAQGPELAALTHRWFGRSPDGIEWYTGPAVDHRVVARKPDEFGLLDPRWPRPRWVEGDTVVTARGDTLVYDTFRVALERGDDDREVAGRGADHYRLRIRVARREPGGEVTRTLELDGDLWVIAAVPFSWVPFLVSLHDIPGLDPRLPDALLSELEPLGLPGRIEYKLTRGAREPGFEGRSTGGDTVWIERFEDVPAPPPPEGLHASPGFHAQLRVLEEKDPEVVCGEFSEDVPDFVADEFGPEERETFLSRVRELCEQVTGG